MIDFGVAKAINQRLTEQTIYTRFQQMVGTPMYMSPEQAELSGLDVDTRSDVYSLGVLLHEVLTGTTPFDKQRFSKAAYDEIRRIIREEEPPKPSTKIGSLGATASEISIHRQTDPRRLSQSLRGDLDWIVMKAIDKDRGRRYETANGFAADVQRFLDDEPVRACRPSAGYRFRKFCRRNRATVVGRPMSGVGRWRPVSWPGDPQPVLQEVQNPRGNAIFSGIAYGGQHPLGECNTPHFPREKHHFSSGVPQSFADLGRLVTLWPLLDDAVRAGVLALVDASLDREGAKLLGQARTATAGSRDVSSHQPDGPK